METSVPLEERALILALERDGPLTREMLAGAGIPADTCATPDELAREMLRGVGLLILAEEVVRHAAFQSVREALDQQPPWSEVPVVLVALPSAMGDRFHTLLTGLRGVQVLHRPLHLDTLITTVRAAQQARRRQYVVRDLLQQRDDYLAMLGHELRNPLAPIATGVRILKAQPRPEQAAKVLERLERQVSHLSGLVGELLEGARAVRGQITLKREAMDLNAAVMLAVEDHELELATTGHVVQVRLSDQPVWVEADPHRLQQILANLFSNVSRHTPAGCSVAVSVERDGADALLRVEDDGPGIPPEHLAYIAGPFVQTPRDLARSEGGLGLGLAVSSHLARLHGGDLQMRNRDEAPGLCVEVRLPAAHE